MRNAFIATLTELARQDERIWLLTGDLGYSVLEPFADEFPGRFLNVGVAEQNMVGVAAGLALSGKVVFTYSIANFPVLRCLEQIRNDVCYHDLDVKVVAVGGGLAYGSAGYSHYAVEDLAVMRALPNMTVVAPGDPVETRLATRAIVDRRGPCYLRLGKAGEAVVHGADPDFRLGRGLVVREGTDLAILTTGGMLRTAVQAADLLSRDGVATRVVSFPTVHPLDADAVRDAAAGARTLCVLEEHGAVGGLSDAVARRLAESGTRPAHFLTLDVPALISRGRIGSQDHLLAASGLNPEAVARRAAEWLRAAAFPTMTPQQETAA